MLLGQLGGVLDEHGIDGAVLVVGVGHEHGAHRADVVGERQAAVAIAGSDVAGGRS